MRVTYWAWRLAVEEKADIEKCVVAALFHDVSHFVSKDYRKHEIKSTEIAKDFLSENGYPEVFTDEVTYAVKSHVGEFNPKTLETKILQDVDILDRFGCFMILPFSKTADLPDCEGLKKKVQSSLEYLSDCERRLWPNVD